MNIRIVLAIQNAGWVIGKMGERLTRELRALGHNAVLSHEPDPSADVNHWMSFAFAPGLPGTLNTMFVTHVDDPFKVALIKSRLKESIDMALCMSPHARLELVGRGIPANKLWYVLPAMDTQLQPRRVNIGITTKVYDDGRKREKLLVRLASELPLQAFKFSIFGSGWEPTIPHLLRAGAEVEYDPGSNDWQSDYKKIIAAVSEFDYYLYLGMDEGSLGTLDAHSAGVKTIVTAQGFHLSLPGGITHPFIEYETLKSIFREIANERTSLEGRLADWSWSNYAREHTLIWAAMAKAKGQFVDEEDLEKITLRSTNSRDTDEANISTVHGQADFYLRALSPRRVLGAIARSKWLGPLRQKLER